MLRIRNSIAFTLIAVVSTAAISVVVAIAVPSIAWRAAETPAVTELAPANAPLPAAVAVADDCADSLSDEEVKVAVEIAAAASPLSPGPESLEQISPAPAALQPAVTAAEAAPIETLPSVAAAAPPPQPRLRWTSREPIDEQRQRIEDYLYAGDQRPLPERRPSTGAGVPESFWYHPNDTDSIAALAADERQVVQVQITDLLEVATDITDAPDASQQMSLSYNDPGDHVLTTVELQAGFYELITLAYGPNGADSDAVTVDVGGAKHRIFGGWKDFEHHSLRPTLIEAPVNGQYLLHIDRSRRRSRPRLPGPDPPPRRRPPSATDSAAGRGRVNV